MSQPDMFSQQTNRFASLEEVIDALKRMKDDPLADAGTNVVVSRGNPNARLLIIGEAPGPEENIKGKPFVGRAGQMLDKVLQAANFDPEQDVYITNSVFRMPPGTDGKAFRKPTDQEIDYYRPFVFEIIHLIDPRVILLTGNVACQSVLQRTGITSLRGNEPWPGYDELTADEVQAVLSEGDDDRAQQVRAYERSHKNRAGVLKAAERELATA